MAREMNRKEKVKIQGINKEKENASVIKRRICFHTNNKEKDKMIE